MKEYIVISIAISSIFYWIGYNQGFKSGVERTKEIIEKTMASCYSIFYEMKKKDV